MAASSRSGEAKPTASQKVRFKQSTYASVGSFTSRTLIKYVPNGKKAGTKSAERYNIYAEARTIEEAFSLGSRVADFLNDFEKALLRPVGGVVRGSGEDVSAEQFAALRATEISQPATLTVDIAILRPRASSGAPRGGGVREKVSACVSDCVRV